MQTSGEPTDIPTVPDDHVFISYSHKDTEFVCLLDASLKSREYRTWIDRRSIPYGEQWKREIERGILHARAVLFVISPDSVKSVECRAELDAAVRRGKRIVALMYRDVADDKVPDALRAIQRIDYATQADLGAAIEAIVRTIETDWEWIREHSRLEKRAADWIGAEASGKCGDNTNPAARGSASALLRGDELRKAERFILQGLTREPHPTALQERYVSCSRAAEKARTRKAMLSFVAVLLTVAALSAAVLRWYGQAKTNESLEYAGKAQQALATDPVRSIEIALKALPRPDDPRPYVPDAEFALTQAVHASHQRQALLEAPTLVEELVDLTDREIAVGGDGLSLVSSDLTNVTRLVERQHQDTIRVLWDSQGTTLLSYDHNSASAWQNGEQVGDLPGQVDRASWRPGKPEAAIGRERTVQIWSYGAGEPVTLHEFPGLVSGLRWSPDGLWLAAWDDKAHLAVSQPELQETLEPQGTSSLDIIRDAAWSFDGKKSRLITVSSEWTYRVWSVGASSANLRVEAELPGASEGILLVDEDRFLTWDYSPTGGAFLRSMAGEELRKFRAEGDPLQDIYLSPDDSPEGRRLLLAWQEREAEVWHLDDDRKLCRLGDQKGRITAAAWEDGYIATGDMEGVIRIWNLATCRSDVTLRRHTGANPDADRADVSGLSWRSDGTLLSYGEDGALRLWQVRDELGELVCEGNALGSEPCCTCLSQGFPDDQVKVKTAFWLDDQTIFAADFAGRPWRWSLETGSISMMSATADPRYMWVRQPDSSRVFMYVEDDSTTDGTIWDLAEDTAVAHIPAPITSAYWTELGLVVGSKAEDGAQTIKLVDADSNVRATLPALPGFEERINAAHAYGDLLAVGGTNGNVYVWNRLTGELVSEYTEPVEVNQLPIRGLQWSADGRRLLITGCGIMVWDMGQGTRISLKIPHNDFCINRTAALSPDGRYVAASNEADFWVFDAHSGSELWHGLPSHTDTISGIRWITGPQWPYQASGSGDRLLRRLLGQARTGNRLALLTWSGDATARLWDWNPLGSHLVEIWRVEDSLGFDLADANSTGSAILTVGYEGELRVWQSWIDQPERLLMVARDLTPSGLSAK